MFTGIIQQVGRVAAIRGGGQSRVLSIEAGALASRVSVGDSVCVDGVCLTAAALDGGRISFDVSAETLRLTTLGDVRTGAPVNLEPALQVGDRLGGHFVSGHADGTGVIRRLEQLPGEVRLEVEAPEPLTDLMILKGSVAVDGISLTIAALRAGDRVNIECDMIGRWVRKLLGRQEQAPGALTISDLEAQGF